MSKHRDKYKDIQTSTANQHGHGLRTSAESAAKGEEEKICEQDGTPPEDVCKVARERNGRD